MRLFKIENLSNRASWLPAVLNHRFQLVAALVICFFISACSPLTRDTASTLDKPTITAPEPATIAINDESREDEQQSLSSSALSAWSPCDAISDIMQEEEEGTPSEPEATLDQEIADLPDLGETTQDLSSPQSPVPDEKDSFPLTMNKQVAYYLDFFQNKQHGSFTRWLERSGRYLPLIREELKKADLPEELAYLPLIESGFNLNAYSKARAVGPWQFIKSTGRLYGLNINSYIDERRDIVASTKAATQFLKELHDEFNSWYLAVAGYNAGAGKIKRAMDKTGSDNFWQLAKSRHLRPETKLYVPKLIAAIMIARNPENYGFTDLAYAPPLNFETVEVPPWTPLRAVALACATDYDEIHEMNRELAKAITPPAEPYTLKVPAGKARMVEQNLDRVRAVVRTTYKNHIVGRKETIAKICRQYNLNTITLLKVNNLRKSKLTSGQHLRIPVQITEYRLLPKGATVADRDKAADGLILHRIRPGETLSTIAHHYGVSTRQLASWNGIKNIRKIRAGRQLALYIENSPYRSDDRPEPALASLNKKKPATRKKTEQSVTYYNVKKGDSLWKIARKFQLTTDQIRQWNDLEGDMIRPGHRLKIKLPAADEEA
jgi:membrane-bound lytic murein transglycosylase D